MIAKKNVALSSNIFTANIEFIDQSRLGGWSSSSVSSSIAPADVPVCNISTRRASKQAREMGSHDVPARP